MSSAALGLCLLLLAAPRAQCAETTIDQMVALVRAGIKQHTPDKTLAKSVRKITLSEKLYLRAVEELESEGAGPETAAALDGLLDSSAKKPEPKGLPPFDSPARPSIDEQKEFFHKIDVNAMHYSASLPDFICTEIVHRYELTEPIPVGATRRRGDPISNIGLGIWQRKDTLTVKLSYFDNREKYQLLLIDGRKTKAGYESTGGAISEGDFGSTLLEIFAPESKTVFQWDHWTHLRKRLTRVYSYRTPRQWSHYKLAVGKGSQAARETIAGRKGFIYADDATQMVMRIYGEAIEIPPGFPVQGQTALIDYEYANISGQPFLLPLRVDTRMKSARMEFKNVVEFRDYRKFTGESTISFDSPDLPPSADQPKPDQPKDAPSK